MFFKKVVAMASLCKLSDYLIGIKIKPDINTSLSND